METTKTNPDLRIGLAYFDCDFCQLRFYLGAEADKTSRQNPRPSGILTVKLSELPMMQDSIPNARWTDDSESWGAIPIVQPDTVYTKALELQKRKRSQEPKPKTSSAFVSIDLTDLNLEF